jgi:hypothetical protein
MPFRKRTTHPLQQRPQTHDFQGYRPGKSLDIHGFPAALDYFKVPERSPTFCKLE